MKRWMSGVAVGLVIASGACETSDRILVPGGGGPAAPVGLDAYYYAGAIYVTWELGTAWSGEPFRVYARRTTDRDYFLIAEVTNCAQGLCSYTDTNISPGRSYDYYVASVDGAGVETATAEAVRVAVPQPVPPPVPGDMRVIALDHANYLRWDPNARTASDFSHYRVYLHLDGQSYLLGETDSEGFVDLLAENGLTYTYFVTSVDDQGHESEGSTAAEGTPRPDFHGDVVWDYFSNPASSGFVFRTTEVEDPIVDGNAAERHFRLETDAAGWWLVPGPGVTVYPAGFETTALKCGVAADAGCVSLDVAPTQGYVVTDLELLPETSYVLRVPGGGGQVHYATLRIQLLGFDQEGSALAIFDWAHQLQAGNPNLAPRSGAATRIRP
jgi:hypothetical protein